jgi:hypothetical protein
MSTFVPICLPSNTIMLVYSLLQWFAITASHYLIWLFPIIIQISDAFYCLTFIQAFGNKYPPKSLHSRNIECYILWVGRQIPKVNIIPSCTSIRDSIALNSHTAPTAYNRLYTTCDDWSTNAGTGQMSLWWGNAKMMRLIWIWDVMSPNSIRKMICDLWYHKLIAESLMKTEIGIKTNHKYEPFKSKSQCKGDIPLDPQQYQLGSQPNGSSSPC